MKRKFPKKRPIAIDFFSGAGGMSLGFEQAGFDVSLGVDCDGHHVATHERNFPYGKSLCTSVIDLDGNKIRSLLNFDGDLDLVFGGPPCQGFSNMGLRDLRDPRNSLVDHYVRLVLDLRPKAFVMENVPGMLAGATRSVLEKVIEVCESDGYCITKPVRILDAADFGVPQKRRRLFVIGVRSDIAQMIPYPEGKCEGQPDRPSIEEAISDLPSIEQYAVLFSENNIPYDKEPASVYARVARGIETDASDLSRPRVWEPSICSGCLRTRHSDATVKLYEATSPGQTVPGHKLPRLDPNGIAPTLRAGSDSTHGSYTAPRPIHPDFPRCITTREAARLHGFPDWFEFYPLKWHGYRQIGNAVCPPVARAVGSSILRTLSPSMTQQAPTSISLPKSFVLPEERPRTLKRIPVMQEFPPVLQYLFDKAYDKAKARLKKPTFTFEDVNKAIAATGSKLHWVREDTFLTEIARSRRIADLLAPIYAAGMSILPLEGSKAIGKFVPLGTPGTLEDKDILHLRMDTIHDARRLPLGPIQFRNFKKALPEFLSRSDVSTPVWGKRGTVRVEANGSQSGDTDAVVVTVKDTPKAKGRIATVLTCRGATLPNKDRIARLAKASNSDEVVVFVSATPRHIVAIRFDCRNKPEETLRVAFQLNK